MDKNRGSKRWAEKTVYTRARGRTRVNDWVESETEKRERGWGG